MTETCIIRNPLQRNGTSQRERLLKALLPSFVNVDERKTEDLLVYATKLAEQVNFFNLQNESDGNWKSFFEQDISTVVSYIALKNASEINQEYTSLRTEFLSSPTKANFKLLFDYIIVLGYEIDNWYLRANAGLTIKSDLLKYIQGSLRDELTQLIAYDKAAEQLYAPDQFNSIEKPKYEKFSVVWNLNIDGTPADTSIYQGVTANDQRKKAEEFITMIFESFYKVQKFIIDRGALYLNETLEKISDHAPHVGLFITFIELFKNAQNHINTITERHLDFFYEDVLRLLPREAISDKVNVIFELAKNIDSHLLTEGTLLNAGKDSTSTDIVFALDDEIVVNKAQIESLRTSFYAIPQGQEVLKNEPGYVPLKNITIAPVANSQNGEGLALDPGQSWATLGEDQDNLPVGTPKTMVNAKVGFAVASPLLLLNDGIRFITLTMTFEGVLPLPLSQDLFLINLKNNLRFYLTGEEGYLEKKAYALNIEFIGGAFTELTITIKLDRDENAVVNYNEAIHVEGFNTNWPLLKMQLSHYDKMLSSLNGLPNFVDGGVYNLGQKVLFRQAIYRCVSSLGTNQSPDQAPSDWYEYPSFDEYYNGDPKIQLFNPYDTLRSLILINLNIAVQVSGSNALVLQSDSAIINPNKPFKPLGVNPTVDSSFLIGSTEIFSKEISDMSIHVEWQDLPFSSMKDYYNQYDPNDNISLDNESFEADFEVLVDRNWQTPDVSGDPLTLSLFETILSSGHVSFTRTFDIGNLQKFRRDPFMSKVENYSLSTKRGFARLVLRHTQNAVGSDAIIEAFGHKEYPNILTDRVILKNQAPATLLPKAPYTPTIKTISINYSSDLDIPLNADSSEREFENRIEQFYNLDLFGYKEVHPYLTESIEIGIKLLPQIDEEGALYIGLNNLNLPQNISFYFQLADGTANPNLAAPEVKYSILSNNDWIQLPGSSITLDSTNGLLRSGIVKLDLPKELTINNSLINDGRELYWIKAYVDNDSDAINRSLQINTQGITASFVDDGNDLNRLRTALPADSITKLRFGDAAIKKVFQPFSSFGGKVKEESVDFYTRVSERLRHKSRAITIYDYERLVLENYPSVYRVKCLNHTKPLRLSVAPDKINSDGTIKSLADISPDAEITPGYVTVVLIADVVNQKAQDQLVPRVSLDTISSVEKYLLQYNSAFVTLGAENPIYEQLTLKFDVAFTTGLDRKFYTSKLNEDLKKFLSPWAFEDPDKVDISFGGRIHRSVLIDFIEERPYVQIVSRFMMVQNLLTGNSSSDLLIDENNSIDEAVAHTSRSILVSAPVHQITAIDFETASRECDAGGIGDMMIRLEDDNPLSGSFVIR